VIKVVLPYHLRNLARVGAEVELADSVDGVPVTTTSQLLDALELRYPVLRGTLRDHGSKQRRAFVRYFVCGKDISLQPDDRPLPRAVLEGEEPFLVIGAIAGG